MKSRCMDGGSGGTGRRGAWRFRARRNMGRKSGPGRTPLAKRSTLTGRVRPAFAVMVEPSMPTGSPQTADQAMGGTKMTWTENEADDELSEASAAVHVTVVSPTGTVDPESGRQAIDG